MSRRTASMISLAGMAALIIVLGVRGLQLASSPSQGGIPVKVQLRNANDRAELVRRADGSLEYVISRSDGSTERFSPEALAEQLYAQGSQSIWSIINVSGPVGLIWVCVGLLGQVLFTGRLLVQWLASEAAHRSVVPPVFWWMSLGGSLMLLAYFIWRWDIVGIFGQAFGYTVYIRNLALIYGERAATPPRGDTVSTVVAPTASSH